MKNFTIHLLLIALVSFSFAQDNWYKHPDPILTHGPDGAWDSLYVQHSSVVFDGTKYHMYYNARSAITDHHSIGHATSPDGIVWQKNTLFNPVLSEGTAGSWDENLAFSPCVIFDGSTFHMWYTGGNGNHQEIGYAWSYDGVVWIKNDDPATTNILYAESDPVLSPGAAGSWDDKHVEVPNVIKQGNSYTMWYLGIKNQSDDPYRIGRATSSDGITWNKDTNPVLSPGASTTWEKGFLRLGSVVFDQKESKYHMFYYAGEFYMHLRIGYAWSSDGITWTKYNDPILPLGQAGSWDDTQVMAPWVIQDTDSTFKMWYTGIDDVNTPGVVSAIGYAWGPVTALEEIDSPQYPEGFVLNQNYPNPFNPSTIIKFQIPNSQFVTLNIYNLLGQKVATLVDKKQPAGSYQVEWDASGFATGIYYYKLTTGDFQQVRKMVLIK